MNQDFREYQEKEQSKLFNKYGAFFMFGNQKEILQELKTKKEEHIKSGLMTSDDKFCSLGFGLYAPTKNAPKIREGMAQITKNKVAKDIKDNGIKNIIIRELYNYETFISYDFDTVISALKPYNVSTELILSTFQKEISNFEKHNS